MTFSTIRTLIRAVSQFLRCFCFLLCTICSNLSFVLIFPYGRIDQWFPLGHVAVSPSLMVLFILVNFEIKYLFTDSTMSGKGRSQSVRRSKRNHPSSQAYDVNNVFLHIQIDNWYIRSNRISQLRSNTIVFVSQINICVVGCSSWNSAPPQCHQWGVGRGLDCILFLTTKCQLWSRSIVFGISY